MDLHDRSGVRENQFVIGADLHQEGFRLRDVVAVADARGQVDAARGVRGDVRDRAAPDAPVRHDDRLVVGSQHDRRDETHVLDLARHAAGVDDLADVVGAVEEDHNAGREVAHRVLQREADDESDDPEGGEDRTRVDADVLESEQEAEEEDDLGDRVDRELLQQVGDLQLRSVHGLVDDAACDLGGDLRSEEDREEDGDLEEQGRAGFDGPVLRLLHHVRDFTDRVVHERRICIFGGPIFGGVHGLFRVGVFITLNGDRSRFERGR